MDNVTAEMIADPTNLLYTCTECVKEIIHLRQIGKIFKRDKGKRPPIVDMVKECGIKIVPITEKHLNTLDELPLVKEHRDPADRLIIAQAITDRALLVSCDTAFPDYMGYGLIFHQNER
ncbi:MAG: type II toxin-antitoxin system VapC family toxin [Prevotellaceae bacterium]|nr:type II toxin-antitoxin system VapC family toxin [Prevotellaceae bacterium]